MKLTLLLFTLVSAFYASCQTQTSVGTASNTTAAASFFLQSLSTTQKQKAQFKFDEEERYNWHYIPRDRKGIPLKELNAAQYKAAMDLLHTALSDTGFQKTTAVIKLETVLREVEGRPDTDTYRDLGNYYFSIFGNPASDKIWGWRLEGHHISFNFSSEDNQLVSATPGFIGSNPAVVLSGQEKGLEILKDETELGFNLLHSLNASQKEKAIINKRAPGDIITASNRKAIIENPQGILYSELNASQQKLFVQLLSLYIHRYTRLFAAQMMKEIEDAGLKNLRFAWAGDKQRGVGHPHYYRIQGPTIIIEYDNTQNNANHIHTVVRDLKNDFGGDQLLEHYKNHQH
ncbi:MAG TPA: DUF3500 domain-containing protein [Flavisolibacter sp.]|nr:DUF3500 domain-containing protein [Flavisolibacter sp.]